MQACPDTLDMIGGPPALLSDDPAILYDLAERAGSVADSNSSSPHHGKRRTAEQIQADLKAQHSADLARLNARYASKLAGAASRIKPVAVRRKEALAKMDELRAIVRRTNPVMDEIEIDAQILTAITRGFGDLVDSVIYEPRHIAPHA